MAQVAQDFTLDELIGIEDAIEAMMGNVRRTEYIAMHKLDSQSWAGRIFDLAQAEVMANGASARKALNFIRRGIDSFRD